MGIESMGDGRSECSIEGAARLGAERDIRFKRFGATKDISYSACCTL